MQCDSACGNSLAECRSDLRKKEGRCNCIALLEGEKENRVESEGLFGVFESGRTVGEDVDAAGKVVEGLGFEDAAAKEHASGGVDVDGSGVGDGAVVVVRHVFNAGEDIEVVVEEEERIACGRR